MILFVILLVLVCGLLGLIILVQNPKGGGLAGNVAGFSNQYMGVKQTTDMLERGTWILATAVVLLCIFSTAFIPKANTKNVRDLRATPTTNTVPASPAQQLPAPQK